MKISMAQQKVLITELINEYRIYAKNPHGRLYNAGSTSTIKAMVSRGLIYTLKDGTHPFATIIQLTDDGREWAKALVSESAIGEMESLLHSRDMEIKRQARESHLKNKIISKYNLAEGDFNVRVSHDLRCLDNVFFDIGFNQMRIEYDRDGYYYIQARGISAQPEGVQVYIDNLLICNDIIESGLLTTPPTE